MKVKNFLCALCIILPLGYSTLKAQTITRLNQPSSASIRGLSVLNDKIAWVSGSKGNFAITANGGETWAWHQVKGYEKLDFRDIEAFSDKEAVIMSSGTPAVILKTTDGGETWLEKYRKTDSAFFLDAMDFTGSKHGFILGDPIKNEFLLLETKDGGDTWKQLKGPPAIANEAAFAASGTCLRVYPKRMVVVTGGAQSRVLIAATLSPNDWTSTTLPLTNGHPARGAFSGAQDKNQLVVVGGNYAKDSIADSVACIISLSKTKIKISTPLINPAGYQSCVEHLDNHTWLSTGTSGSNITTDGGKIWHKIDTVSYNVCRKAKFGNLVLLAGDRGKIGVYAP